MRTTKMRSKLALLFIALAAMIALPAVAALADQVTNNLDATVDTTAETMALNEGGSSQSTLIYVNPANGDGKQGCNLQGDSITVSVTSSNTAAATVSPSSITLSGCGPTSGKAITVTPVKEGTAQITLSGPSSINGGTLTYGQGTFDVNVAPPPNTAPSISVTGVVDKSQYEYGSVPKAQCSVKDKEDGDSTFDATLSEISGDYSTYKIGNQTASCSYTDEGGLEAQASATYEIVDTIAPVLTIPTSDITKEATGASGASVSYSASAKDAVFGDVAVTCTPASGSTFALGTTEVTCSAEDSLGNKDSKSFNVTVEDTTAPEVTVPANITAEATGPNGAAVNFTASAEDLVDGAITPDCLPASGSVFPIATTTVSCTATDAASNTSDPETFSVTVRDTTAPALNLPSDITAEATGPSGAAVSYSASASDLVDGAITPNCSPASGSTFALGTKQVDCSATDAAGNSASGSFNVTVRDTTAPALDLPSNITKQATSNSQAQVSYSASASDLVDGAITPNCSPASGANFPAGTTTVNCSATDAAGNKATGSFTVTVNYGFSGFRSPVDNLPTVNSVKAGSAVPIKFSLSGNQGQNIFASGFPKATVSSCDSSAAVDSIEETVTAGSSSLSYDATADQYNYVWKTDKAWGGKCIQLEVKFADGSSKFAKFKMLK